MIKYLEDAYQVVGKDIGPSSCCEQEALNHAIDYSSEQLHYLGQEESHLHLQ